MKKTFLKGVFAKIERGYRLTPISWPPGVSALDALNDSTWQRHQAEKNLRKLYIDHQRSFFANTLFNDNSPNNVQAISETFKKIFNYVRVEMFSNNPTGCRL